MSLARALATRRSAVALDDALPPARRLARILAGAHGVTGAEDRGPTPSAGGLQALELYLASWSPGWLPPGFYHYDRAGHALEELAAGATRDGLAALVPSLALYDGGALLVILTGDHARVAARYGARAGRFLLLEAGALLQNLCLLSTANGLCTVPLGAVMERALGRRLQLPRGDRVLVAGVMGATR
jgi:SagB-type dehydrogenase family enzyme